MAVGTRTAAALLAIGASLTWQVRVARADDLGATVKLGPLHPDHGGECVNFTVTNTSTDFESSVGIESAALSDGEPIDTAGATLVNLASGQRGYESICFYQLSGRSNIKPTCRVDAVNKRE